MAGEILSQSGGEFLDAAMHVLVNCLDDVRNGFSAHRLVVRIGLTPNRHSRLAVEQFKLKRETSEQLRLIHFVKRVEMAAENIVAALHAADSCDRRVLAAGPQR